MSQVSTDFSGFALRVAETIHRDGQEELSDSQKSFLDAHPEVHELVEKMVQNLGHPAKPNEAAERAIRGSLDTTSRSVEHLESRRDALILKRSALDRQIEAITNKIDCLRDREADLREAVGQAPKIALKTTSEVPTELQISSWLTSPNSELNRPRPHA